ncbi:hypothetical protein OROHE_014473 [Orobanche hederae]
MATTPPPNPNLFDLDTIKENEYSLELRDARELCKLYCEYSGRLAPFVAAGDGGLEYTQDEIDVVRNEWAKFIVSTYV